MDRRGFLGRLVLMAVAFAAAAPWSGSAEDAEEAPQAARPPAAGLSTHGASHFRELAG